KKKPFLYKLLGCELSRHSPRIPALRSSASALRYLTINKVYQMKLSSHLTCDNLAAALAHSYAVVSYDFVASHISGRDRQVRDLTHKILKKAGYAHRSSPNVRCKVNGQYVWYVAYWNKNKFKEEPPLSVFKENMNKELSPLSKRAESDSLAVESSAEASAEPITAGIANAVQSRTLMNLLSKAQDNERREMTESQEHEEPEPLVQGCDDEPDDPEQFAIDEDGYTPPGYDFKPAKADDVLLDLAYSFMKLQPESIQRAFCHIYKIVWQDLDGICHVQDSEGNYHHFEASRIPEFTRRLNADLVDLVYEDCELCGPLMVRLEAEFSADSVHQEYIGHVLNTRPDSLCQCVAFLRTLFHCPLRGVLY
ncbi:hypothetical protein ACKKKR_005001, partial [Escherichia coli]